MQLPTSDPCRCTYRKIQAHCAVRLSIRVGAAIRSVVGATGDITSLLPAALQSRFVGSGKTESLRLLALANRIKAKYGGGDHGQID